jgi:hypothetical protein
MLMKSLWSYLMSYENITNQSTSPAKVRAGRSKAAPVIEALCCEATMKIFLIAFLAFTTIACSPDSGPFHPILSERHVVVEAKSSSGFLAQVSHNVTREGKIATQLIVENPSRTCLTTAASYRAVFAPIGIVWQDDTLLIFAQQNPSFARYEKSTEYSCADFSNVTYQFEMRDEI